MKFYTFEIWEINKEYPKIFIMDFNNIYQVRNFLNINYSKRSKYKKLRVFEMVKCFDIKEERKKKRCLKELKK